MTLQPILAGILLALSGQGVAASPDPASPELAHEIESALVRAGERGAIAPGTGPVTVRAPASARFELGAVVDPGADGGPVVLALTPGGAAERIGLRRGDRLVSINGQRLAGAPRQPGVMERALGAGNGSLRIEAARDGGIVRLAGTADVLAVPGYSLVVGDAATEGCGFVTDTAGPTPRSRDIYRAEITRIDGRSTPLTPVNRHRIPAGRHVLTVREMIDRSWLSQTQTSQIARMQKFEDADAYKPLVIDVSPGTNYRIGARLLRDRLDGESIRANAYWEPVVWSELREDCR